MRSRVLILGVIGALLASFVLSFAFVRTASAAPHACVFQAVSTVTAFTVGGSENGPLAPLTLQITKYTDGCGHEFGTMTISGYSFGFDSFQASVSVRPSLAFTSTNNLVTFLSTPVASGEGMACGSVIFTVHHGSGSGGGCTAS